MTAPTWPRVLGWRVRRQLLDPASDGSVADVVARLGAVPAWPDPAMELTVGVRRAGGRTGDAARALAANEVVKVYAFRGATHLMTPQDAGAYLAVRASSRMWELPSWVSFYRLAPEDWPRFREFVREAVADRSLTLSELTTAFGRSSRYRHLQAIIDEGNETLIKPLTWQGDLGLGPPRDGEATFQRLDDVPGWAGLPDLDEAGPAVVAAYLHVFGPASPARIHDWVGKGLGAGRAAVTRWLGLLDDRLETVTVEGDALLALREDVEDLRTASASTAVRLLPGRDPWVMAPGTSDPHVVPPAHREVVSRSANLVVSRGVLAGTWAVRRTRLEVDWFTESGRVPRAALDGEAARLSTFLDRPLELAVG
ncbi:DNA glycosylase AlkZ-like family protein [Nocardioides cynanchi]|uniref:DNA glycosylase AlkZ-like family protein n=1 Tax=Nocardioides cynanchi TaxID=2558918 RepID=UPI001247EA12|nr:crosslink repair DNA glycosylase YcaQ family protein [Nocardioides cynanchi]